MSIFLCNRRLLLFVIRDLLYRYEICVMEMYGDVQQLRVENIFTVMNTA